MHLVGADEGPEHRYAGPRQGVLGFERLPRAAGVDPGQQHPVIDADGSHRLPDRQDQGVDIHRRGGVGRMTKSDARTTAVNVAEESAGAVSTITVL